MQTLPRGSPTIPEVLATILVEKSLLPQRSQSSGALSVPDLAATPVVPVPGVPIVGMWPNNVLLLADALPANKPLISISGQSFHLPIPAENVFQQSLSLAESFHHLFHLRIF